MRQFRSVPCMVLLLYTIVKEIVVASENNRKTRVLMPEDFELYSPSSSQETFHPSELWQRASGSNPLFPFTRRTTETPPSLLPQQQQQHNDVPAGAAADDVSIEGRPWTPPVIPNWWNSRPWFNWRSTTAAPATTTTSTTTIKPVIVAAAAFDDRVAICTCVATASNCSLDFTLDPYTSPQLIQRLSITDGWDIPECNINDLLCCRIVSATSISYLPQHDNPIINQIPSNAVSNIPEVTISSLITNEVPNIVFKPPEMIISNIHSPLNTNDVPDYGTNVIPSGVLASSCRCLTSADQCPADSHVTLHLIACPGITCCSTKKPVHIVTPQPSASDTCHCVLDHHCRNNESSKQAPFCKPPYKLCCVSSSNIVLQPTTPKPSPKPIPILLPTGKDCHCVTSHSECPLNSDILFHLDSIDIRNGESIICPKPNLICCASPIISDMIIPTLVRPTQKPILTTPHKPALILQSDNMCICVDRESSCSGDNNIIPEYFGAKCGRPRVWCCKPEVLTESSTEQLSASLLSTSPPSSLKPPPSPALLVSPSTESSLIITPISSHIEFSTITPPVSSTTPPTLPPLPTLPVSFTTEFSTTPPVSSLTQPISLPTLPPSPTLPVFSGTPPSFPARPVSLTQLSPTSPPSASTTPSSLSNPLGAWCHCTDKNYCKKFRLDDKISESVCGKRQILCCEDDLETKPMTTTIPPLRKCVFGPLFPEEGSCKCSERDTCLLDTGAFFSESPALCSFPLGACCRAMRQCRVPTGGLDMPWMAAVVTRSRGLICSAVVVHRLAVLVPANCIQGRDLSALTVQLGVGVTACGLGVGLVIPASLDLALLLLQDAPQSAVHQFSPACLAVTSTLGHGVNETIDTDNCIVASLVKSNRSREIEIRQDYVKLTENNYCNSVNVLQKSNEICMKSKFNYNFDTMCGGGWGAAVLCRIRGSPDRHSLVGVQTRRSNNCARSASLVSNTRDRGLVDAVHYLSNLCPQSS